MARQSCEIDQISDVPTTDNRLRVFRPASLELYKMIGDESSVVEYFERRKRPSGDASVVDWTGAYFQLNTRHCLGTLGYRFDQGYTLAQLVKVTCGPPAVPIRVVRDEFMADPSLAGSEKALRVKRILHLPESEPLVEQLDGSFLLCRENGEEWEMVCNLDNVSQFVRQETVVCEFKWNAATGRWVLCRFPGDGDSSTWQRFDDSCTEFVEQHFGQNEVPGWAQSIIS